jgi:hypothetical protein
MKFWRFGKKSTSPPKLMNWSEDRIDLLLIALGVAKLLLDFGIAAYYDDQIDEETIRKQMKIHGEALIGASQGGKT